MVSIDRTHLSRVVTNLVTNAIKFTDAGHVAVAASVNPERELLIRVRDSGIGMSSEDLSLSERPVAGPHASVRSDPALD